MMARGFSATKTSVLRRILRPRLFQILQLYSPVLLAVRLARWRSSLGPSWYTTTGCWLKASCSQTIVGFGEPDAEQGIVMLSP